MTSSRVISPVPVWADLVPGKKMTPAWVMWVDELRKLYAESQGSISDTTPVGPASFSSVDSNSPGELSQVLSRMSDIQQTLDDIQFYAVSRPEVQSLSYATFVDVTTQTAAATNTAYAITLSDQYLSSGIYRDAINTSRVYVTKAGIYNFQFSAQMTKSSASLGHAYIWFRTNGVDAPYSASRLAFQGANSDIVPSWNWFMPMKADDYFELMWAVDDTGISIPTIAAPAFAPAIPSVILTVSEVSI